MGTRVKNYIDFEKLFLDLFTEQEEILKKEQYQAEHYKQIIDFKAKAYEEFELLLDECDYIDGEIVFVFSYDFNDANESSTRSSTADYVIVYSTVLEEFTSCNYEQG